MLTDAGGFMGVCQGASWDSVSQGSEEGWMVRRCPLRAASTRRSFPRLQGVYWGKKRSLDFVPQLWGPVVGKINGEMMRGCELGRSGELKFTRCELKVSLCGLPSTRLWAHHRLVCSDVVIILKIRTLADTCTDSFSPHSQEHHMD